MEQHKQLESFSQVSKFCSENKSSLLRTKLKFLNLSFPSQGEWEELSESEMETQEADNKAGGDNAAESDEDSEDDEDEDSSSMEAEDEDEDEELTDPSSSSEEED